MINDINVFSLIFSVVSDIKLDSQYGATLTISNASSILGDCGLGDSIAVNGICLTVTSFTEDSFTVGCAPETLRRTNVGSLQVNSEVNLERAVSANTRMGGHFVQGHVDTVAELVKREEDGEALTLRLKPRDKQVMRYIVEKGYVTLDGASLTITKVDEEWFEIMLIAYTQTKIVTALKKEGEYINVEVDQIGKYVERAVEGYFAQGTGGDIAILEKMVERIVEAKLAKLSGN